MKYLLSFCQKTRRLINIIRKDPAVILLVLFLFAGVSGWIVNISGCQSSGPRKVSELDPVKLAPAIKNVDEASKKAGDIAKKVGDSATKIDSSTDSIRANTDSTEVYPKIEPHINNIKAETENLRQDQVELNAVQKQLESTKNDLDDQKKRYEAVTKNVDELRGTISNLEKENTKLKDENAVLFKKLLAWLGVTSIVGIGVSAILAFLTKSPWAIILGIGCLVTLGLSIVVSLYMTWIAYITIGVFAVLIVGAILYLMKHQQNQSKAIHEVVQTNEVSKQYLSSQARLHIFGHGAEGGVADRIQNPITKKIVAQIRSADETAKGIKLATPIATVSQPVPVVPQTAASILEQASPIFAKPK